LLYTHLKDIRNKPIVVVKTAITSVLGLKYQKRKFQYFEVYYSKILEKPLVWRIFNLNFY